MSKKVWIPLVIILVILGVGAYYVSTFRLKEVQVVGCVMSSEELVRETVKEEAPMGNVLLLYLKNQFSSMRDIPFVAKLDIEFIDKNTLKVTVYEKQVAGCIEYMNNYVYFDRDGIVLESSDDRKTGVPCIDGLEIMNWTLNEELPIDYPERFSLILNITQLIEKYELDIDRIMFTREGNIVLRYKKIDVELGDGSNLTPQLMNLKSILSGLEGKKGVLYMKEFNSDTSTASFKEK